MIEILYRPTQEIGYFMLKSEFLLIILITICFSAGTAFLIARKTLNNALQEKAE